MFSYKNNIVQEDIRQLCTRTIPYEKLSNKTVLVTGANGMLATYLVYTFMYLNEHYDKRIKVLALVRNEERGKQKFADFLHLPYFELVVQDVCDTIDYKSVIHYIIHAAGGASPKYIMSDPVGIIRANTVGTMNVLECARTHRTERVLYMSTREIYGKMSEGKEKISETDGGVLDPLEFRSCYPESKRLSETLLTSYAYEYGVPFAIVRIAHSYGPGMMLDHDGRVMADLISDTVNSRNIVLKSHGTAERAFCYITDALAGVFLAMLDDKENEAYNIANETEPKMIRDVAQMLVELFLHLRIPDIPNQDSEFFLYPVLFFPFYYMRD